MAIGKWIPFASSPAPATPAPVVVQQPPIVSAADAKCFGLENFGNTCYANSVLQALYFCGPFRELLLQYPDPSVPEVPPLPSSPPNHAQPPPPQPSSSPQHSRRKPGRAFSVSESSSQHIPNLPPPIPIPPSPPTLLSALRSLYLHISRNPSDKGTVAPRAFIDKLKELNELFRGSAHQDAHEFLNFLLNKIMEEMEDDRRRLGSIPNGAPPSGEDLSNSVATLSTIPPSAAFPNRVNSTIVHRLFEGVLTSETRCLTCETVSSRDESFLDLSIDIDQNSSVTACLRQFSASEMLCQKNKFFCDSCCDLQEAEKRMKIKKLPNVLALHLKRFKYQEDVGKYIKLAYRVAFPLELRLFNTVDDAEDPDRLYELFAIVVHIGTGPYHGHYVTIIKARGSWMLFDDDTVTTIKESDIPKYYGDSNSGSAYVLYYQAVDLDLTALGLKPATPPPGSSTDIGSAPSKPLSLATATEASEYAYAHASGDSAPAMPPGLTEEPDSDKSDSPMPVTPSTHPIPLSAGNTPKMPSAPAPPSLVVSIPPSGSSTAYSSPQPPHVPVPASPSQHNHTLGGLFQSIRQSPSLRLRANGSANHSSENRRSQHEASGFPLPSFPYSPSSRRPRTAQSTASTAETSHQAHEPPGTPSAPSSPVPSKGLHAFPNGSAAPKSPEKKPSAWFKRKSSRQDNASSGVGSPVMGKDEPSWFHRSGKDAHSHARLGRRGSEAAISDAMTSPALPSSPIVPSPDGPLAAHKKSSPELSRSIKRDKRSSGAKLPPRPSTAGARIGSSSDFGSRPLSMSAVPPLPPLPGSPTSPGANGEAAAHVPGKGAEKDADGSSGTTTASAPTAAQRRSSPQPIPHASPHPQPRVDNPSSMSPQGVIGLGFSTSYGSAGSGSVADTPIVPSSSGSGSGSSAGTNWKRATRKLSLTAPMLGLGRKDKDRQKDRERTQGPPSAFAR
ncbi:cysteine proteinase [Trametes coccinea BRFM310]|uniref:Ubiquitin carboxyl-terminal hydrolase n=1 Tax=Trametes coccinea (strain BRFM310) TaxID=1353009 RepID=A0A1Y2IIZ8_TRAC3|nr:cysteine proteinase [Trametes coccinea BRFM310]